MKTQKLVLLCCFVATLIIGNGCSSPSISSQSALPLALPYTTIKSTNTSMSDRKRFSARILSDSSYSASSEQRAQTVIAAALEIQQQTHADFVEVCLDISKLSSGGLVPFAIARYAPDGKGISGQDNFKWEVKTSETKVSEHSPKIADLWFENRESFLKPNGSLDELRLKNFISQKLGIKRDLVHLASSYLIDYPQNALLQ